MEKLILPFNTDEIRLDQVGGKGLNLSKTIRGGFPVPPGFILTAEAYRLFTRMNQIDGGIEDLGREASLDHPASMEAVSMAIGQRFEAGRMPLEIQTAILNAYRELCSLTGNAPVAVRSSATAEDLPGASFAGQQDTYLNIRGEQDLLEAIRHCWASLWTARAMTYRAHQGIDPRTVSIAVVVQWMVPSESSGVMFTANPVTGVRDEVVINAAWGLGEAIVAGLVVPDNLVVDKGNGKIRSRTYAAKTVMTVATEHGTKEQPVPAQKRRAGTLNAARAAELASLGIQIEHYYGTPQDIEWCFAAGRFYIVQVRPITVLPPEPLKWVPPGEGQWLHGGGTFEMITEPISPLSETLLLPIFARRLIRLVEDFGLKGVLPAVPYRVVNGHIYLHMDLHLRPWHLTGIVRDFASHLDSLKDQDAENALYHQTVADLTQTPAQELTPLQLLEQINALGQAGMRYWVQIMKIVQVIYRRESAFTAFYNRRLRHLHLPEPEIFLRGQKILPMQAEASVFNLVQLARRLGLDERLQAAPEQLRGGLEDGPEIRTWRTALGEHLERFGHQLASFDLALPTLADDPRPVLTALQSYLHGKESPLERQQRMVMEREVAVAAAATCFSPHSRRKFRQLLENAQQAARIREDALFDVGLAWTYMHRAALELGSRLVQEQVLAQPEDVFWLHQDEIRSILSEADVKPCFTLQVAERKAQNASWTTMEAPYLLPIESKPAFWWKWVFPTPELNRPSEAHVVTGFGVSPGRVTAVARVVRSLEEAQTIRDGQILVTRTTTPAWTPLFARLAGLVTDLGGPLAHGSIVAREYGIPAVMGTGSATRRIQDGERITVDGTAGRVTLG
jgi:pyruvate,water dikinase